MIRLLWSSLRFYRRTHLGVLLGAALAAAVLTGSLLVGDSVDGTLRRYALQRLGGIHYAMDVPHRYFSDSLSDSVSGDAAALLKMSGMGLSDAGQVNRVTVLGCTPDFWTFCGLQLDLAAGEAALGRQLADKLKVKEGDEVSLRIAKPGLLPLDAPLSAQDAERSIRGRFRVARILGDDELGRFGLSVSQTAPLNAFVNLQWLQERTERQGWVNLLVTGDTDPAAAVEEAWRPQDFGLHFKQHGPLIQLESNQVYLEPEAVRAALSLPGAVGTLTYLVNELSVGDRSTPYSFVLAEDRAALADDEIIINRWLAEELDAQPGDSVEMRYFELLPSGEFAERMRTFTVIEIIEMDELAQERELAPPFPGLTDVDRCADWDVGMPMNEEALEDEGNEAYWEAYRQTPKAIVSLKAGQAMWSNRFGSLTSVRWQDDGSIESAFKAAYQPEAAGFRFLPVREQALASVEHAMDFGGLFLGMSFFLILSALLLTGLIFVFGMQQRAEEMGILLAAGWRKWQVRRLQAFEGGIIALAGALLGSWAGIGYTKLLIFGLAHGWGGAVANTTIHYYAKPGTVWTGAAIGFVAALVAMVAASRRLAGRPLRELLMADFVDEFNPSVVKIKDRKPIAVWSLSAGLLLLAAGIALYAMIAEVKSVVMPFFTAGALLLTAGILISAGSLRRMGRENGDWSLPGLAFRNAGRRKGRSLTVIGLMASGCFLVFAVSSMQEDVTAHAEQSWSGTGGFQWFGQSTLGIKDKLDGINLRVRDGDDASCLNLSRARLPRLLGVNPGAISAQKAFLDGEDIWDQLNLTLPDGMVPGLVGDSDTAMWGLEVSTGIEQGDVLEYVDDYGKAFRVKLVGALPMRLSVFQGSILIAEQEFTERYPSESGYRMFLLNEWPASGQYDRLGLDVIPSVERLLEFYAVESTYLKMFLVLGTLGLAVGSLGMGIVVLRNVQDRRAELALLQAVGYRPRTIRRLLFIEHGRLLLSGLGWGMLSALIAMIPALFITRTHVSLSGLAALLLLVVACAGGCMVLAVGTALRGTPLRGLRNE